MALSIRWRYKLDRFLHRIASAFHSEPKPTRRPRLCPACSTLVGSTATKCHECGASLTFSLAAASRSLTKLLPSTSPATYCIVVLNGLLFTVSLLATVRSRGQLNLFGGISPQVLERMGASLPLPYNVNQPWRLVMAIFLHGGLLHIAMNSWVLMDIGHMVEEVYGSARYLFIYVLTGMAGFVLSSFWLHFSVGASGALMGLIGVMLAITTRRGGAYMQMVRSQLIRWVMYILFFGLLIPGIDNLAHLGGLGAGFLIGRVMEDRQPATMEERRRAYTLGWLTGLVILGCFFLMVQYR
ncbi:MAG: rhomboid family intramembrane serine protease [Acidobacteria bacterium]|nr:rhomboid family intramembrane serine protease [Acidobacteriota bacterium]